MFTITHKGQVVNYDAVQLLTQLTGRMIETEATGPQVAMTQALIERLAPNLDKTTPSQIVELAFRLGYLFRLTLEKYDVVFTDSKSADPNGNEDSE